MKISKTKGLIVLILAQFTFLFTLIYEGCFKEKESIVADYSLQNCSYIYEPEKVMVCFDFNQDGKSLGAYATSTKTIFLRTTNQDTVRHEALHHLLYRDTKMNDKEQHKFIEDLETIEMEIFNLRTK